jgi:hypothetical protein
MPPAIRVKEQVETKRKCLNSETDSQSPPISAVLQMFSFSELQLKIREKKAANQ